MMRGVLPSENSRSATSKTDYSLIRTRHHLCMYCQECSSDSLAYPWSILFPPIFGYVGFPIPGTIPVFNTYKYQTTGIHHHGSLLLFQRLCSVSFWTLKLRQHHGYTTIAWMKRPISPVCYHL